MAKTYIEYEKGKKVGLSEGDVPELTGHFFKKAKFFKEALPELHSAWKRSQKKA